MIEVRNLTKNYGRIRAVDDVSFKVEKGEIVGFLGPNGAGKTTTMNILTGYISASSGQALVDGFDVSKDPMEVKKRIGYLPEHPPIYLDMTVKEYLSFVAELNRISREEYAKQIKDITEIVKIKEVYTRLCKNLSKGYRQRVGLAAALIGNPEVLILDEPTVGLDPIQIIEIRRLIKELGRDHTIILSSHILPEVSAVCERVIIINQGKIVAEDTPEKLSSALNAAYKFTITAEGDYQQIEGIIRTIDGIKDVVLKSKDNKASEIIIESMQHLDVRREVFFKLARNGIPIIEMKLNQMTLEDIFLKVTTREEGGIE
jgi:ABC-2 type transport system ATP-binding protein